MIALTSDPSFPRNSKQILSKHPKKKEINKLCTYNLLEEELKWANYCKDVKKKEELETEFANRKAKIQQLHGQIRREMFANSSVVFCPRERVIDNDLIHFRPDLQMIINAKLCDKVNVWKILSQVTTYNLK